MSPRHSKKVKAFTFTIQYFKPSGKFYSESELSLEIDGGDRGVPYMPDVCACVRALRETGNLPGLGSGRWPGPIYITHPEAYPCLILD